jgi:4'-phosphopantetheinyl transferase
MTDRILLFTCIHVDTIGWLPSLQELLSSEERMRRDRFVTLELKERFTISRGFLRLALGYSLDLDPAKLQIEVGPRGKPFLPDQLACHFSLSHTENRTWVAVAFQGSIGIDVEEKENCQLPEIASLFLTREENIYYHTLPARVKFQYLLQSWTQKEAALKAWGTGLSIDPTTVILQKLVTGHWSQVTPPPARHDLPSLWVTPVEDASAAGCIALAGPLNEPVLQIESIETCTLLSMLSVTIP